MLRGLHIALLAALISAFLITIFLPKEAMFAKNEQTGQIQIQICSARGTYYLQASELLEKTNHNQPKNTQIKAFLLSKNKTPLHNKHKGKNHFACPSIIPASNAIASAPVVPIHPVRIVMPLDYRAWPMAVFVGQMPIRLSARGPPLFS